MMYCFAPRNTQMTHN